MPPSRPLPYPVQFTSPEEYITSLLAFTTNPLFQTLCGGVHILDFFTRDSDTAPIDLYHSIIPPDWISFFSTQEISPILDYLLRTPIDQLPGTCPESLVEFISQVRTHSLNRDFTRRRTSTNGAKRSAGVSQNGEEWALNAGMRPKKIHEVENFSSFVDGLVSDVKGITHIIDFGSGQAYLSRTLAKKYGHNVVGIESLPSNIAGAKEIDERFENLAQKRARSNTDRVTADEPSGTLQYIQKRIEGNDLTLIIDLIRSPETRERGDKSLLLISLHSCGNLLHHGITSFLSTPSVKAIALIGCCYNLLTEKHGSTYKPPLRDLHPRLATTSSTPDPHGFPLCNRLTQHSTRLNITARMMACQAPGNWTAQTSEAFFTRHYYRALLQRVFFDRGLVRPEEPVIIGSLRKKCYGSFVQYFSGAVEKLDWRGRCALTDAEVREYEESFCGRKKDLSVLWSLMAFCAGVVESLIVVDRWCALMEGVEGGLLKEAWVEVAFEYGISPRNLVVVGVR